MSWNFVVHNINQSFEQLAQLFRDFMHRTEQSFKSLHQRIMFLEDRQPWQGPSDEQVERVLRKILAERFADAGVQRVDNPNAMKHDDYFVERPGEDASIPKAIPIDIGRFEVDPSAVPSKQYRETLQMLEGKLPGFPETNVSKNTQNNDTQNDKESFKRPAQPSSNQHQTKEELWS